MQKSERDCILFLFGLANNDRLPPEQVEFLRSLVGCNSLTQAQTYRVMTMWRKYQYGGDDEPVNVKQYKHLRDQR